jgi:hypothetical protein
LKSGVRKKPGPVANHDIPSPAGTAADGRAHNGNAVNDWECCTEPGSSHGRVNVRVFTSSGQAQDNNAVPRNGAKLVHVRIIVALHEIHRRCVQSRASALQVRIASRVVKHQ